MSATRPGSADSTVSGVNLNHGGAELIVAEQSALLDGFVFPLDSRLAETGTEALQAYGPGTSPRAPPALVSVRTWPIDLCSVGGRRQQLRGVTGDDDIDNDESLRTGVEVEHMPERAGAGPWANEPDFGVTLSDH